MESCGGSKMGGAVGPNSDPIPECLPAVVACVTLTLRTLIPVLPSLCTQDLTHPKGSVSVMPPAAASFHSPRGVYQTLSHQLQLPLCPCQLLLKKLGQALLFTIAILFLLQIKDTLRNRRFVGSCSCRSKDITRTPWVSTPDICSPLSWLSCSPPLLSKIPWAHPRMNAPEFLEVASPPSQAPLEIPGHTKVWEPLP